MSDRTVTSTGRPVHWMHNEVNLGEDAPSIMLNMLSSEEQDLERRYEQHGPLNELKTEPKHYQPQVLYWSFNACSQKLATIDPSAWKAVCATVGEECPALSRVNFTINSNESGVPTRFEFLAECCHRES